VSSTADSGPNTLRQAILDAAPESTVTFAPHLAGQTITLSSVLAILKDLTIDGSSLQPPVTLSGGNASRLIEVHPFSIVRLTGLMFAEGSSDNFDRGGAITNWGPNLTVSGCTFQENESPFGGGAIVSYTGLDILASTFLANSAVSDDGGAILIVAGGASVTNSTFVDNTAGLGGAIAIDPGA